MRIDMHVHTRHSMDCRMPVIDVLRAAKARGLDGVAVTDHGTIAGGLEAERIAEGLGLVTIVGAEMLTDMGEVIGYFLTEEVKAHRYLEVVDEIKGQGGVACIPHPFDTLRTSSLRPTPEMLRGIDRVEVFNARCVFQRFNDDALRFARENALGFSAGSDAHTLDEVGNAGVTVRSLEDLRKGRVEIFGTSSPAYKLLAAKLRKRLRRLREGFYP